MNIINLPNEVLVHIFGYLYPDIPKLRQVCVAFNSICRSYKLMKFCKPYYRRLYNINGKNQQDVKIRYKLGKVKHGPCYSHKLLSNYFIKESFKSYRYGKYH